MNLLRCFCLVFVALGLLGCDDTHTRPDGGRAETDAGPRSDAGEPMDAGAPDAGRLDAGVPLSGRTWTRTEAIATVPRMPYQRTRLAVDGDGEPWIAHQRCESSACDFMERMVLQMTRRTGGAWVTDDIVEIRYSYNYDFLIADVPLVAFSDDGARVFAWEMGAWRETVIDADAVGAFGHLALFTEGDRVHLLSGGGDLRWTVREAGTWGSTSILRDEVQPLPYGPDTTARVGSELFVVHRRRTYAPFPTSFHDPASGAWRDGPDVDTGWEEVRVSVARRGDEVCLVARPDSHLAMFCGDGERFASADIPAEQAFQPPVARTLPDGTLAVGYMAWSEEAVRLLTLSAGATAWQIEEISDGPGYGLDLAVAPDGSLAASFVSCGRWPSEDCALVYAERR